MRSRPSRPRRSRRQRLRSRRVPELDRRARPFRRDRPELGPRPAREEARANSWATGTNPKVDSLYLRIRAKHAAITGHAFNLAQGGATVTDLVQQAREAVALKPVPQLIVVQIMDNDIICPATAQEYASFLSTFASAIAVLARGAPHSRIFVVSQFGSPGTFAASLSPSERLRFALQSGIGGGPCDFVNPEGKILDAKVGVLDKDIHGYEAELKANWLRFRQCRYDGGAAGDIADRRSYVSSDLNHFSIGQRQGGRRRVGGDAAHGRHPARHSLGRRDPPAEARAGRARPRRRGRPCAVPLGHGDARGDRDGPRGRRDGLRARREVRDRVAPLVAQGAARRRSQRARARAHQQAARRLDERERNASGWRSESVGVLLWALSSIDDMPAYDTRFETLPPLVPLLAPTGDFRATASLRAPDVLGQARETAQVANGGAPGPIAAERLHTLDWLSGDGSDWDDVPTGA